VNDPISILLRASVHQFIGRLGKDPETRYLESGKCVTNVNIGVNQLADNNQTDWIKLEIWGETGQAFADAARKGYQVHVGGRIKTDRWTDRNTGEEKMQLCCRVESWKVLSAPQGQGGAAPAPAPATAPAAPLPPHLAAAGWNGQPAPAAAPAPAPAPVAAPTQVAPPTWQSSVDPPF